MEDRTQAVERRRIRALALSRGFGIGPVRFFEDDDRRPIPLRLSMNEVEPEIRRFRLAVDSAAGQLRRLSPTLEPGSDTPVAHILGVQLLMIEGSSLVDRAESIIHQQHVNAEWALKKVADEYLAHHSSVQDKHIQEKRLDIEDVVARILNILNGGRPGLDENSFAGTVIVSHELRPSTVMELAKHRPAAFVTESGGWTSHSSIVAREFHIPMVSGVRDVRQTFAGVDRVMVDGVAGAVILHPDPHSLDHLGDVSVLVPAPLASNSFPASLSTLDGVGIAIRANVENVTSYLEAKQLGASGVGLFRSESLIASGRFPTEDEQFVTYSKIAAASGRDGVKIRTFDLSGNENGDDLREGNPALGLRSLRLSLSAPKTFRRQVRAIFRSSHGRNVDIVLPMVSGFADIARAKVLLDEERSDLMRHDIEIGRPQLGAMIELPSAVLTIDSIAANVDFLCLGTNDLVQYLLAVDRDNEAVAKWYESLHPAVIRAIGDVIAAGDRHRVPVQICGEMAGSPFYVPLLIGLGARELSMNIHSIAPVRRLVSGISRQACVELAEKAARCVTADETEQLLRSRYLAQWLELFPDGLLDLKHR